MKTSTAVFGTGLFLFVFALIANLVASFQPDVSDEGGQELTIQVPNQGAREVKVERSIGSWGTKFVAIVRVTPTQANVIKGYVIGSTGANIGIGGQSLGFGIGQVSSSDFWIESRKLPNNDGQDFGRYTHKVLVNFSRIVLLVANQRQVSRVGEITVETKN